MYIIFKLRNLNMFEIFCFFKRTREIKKNKSFTLILLKLKLLVVFILDVLIVVVVVAVMVTLLRVGDEIFGS